MSRCLIAGVLPYITIMVFILGLPHKLWDDKLLLELLLREYFEMIPVLGSDATLLMKHLKHAQYDVTTLFWYK